MKQTLLLIFIPLLRATDFEVFTADDKQYVKLSPYCITAAERSEFSFQVLAQNDAHVALMSADNTADPLYEIVIGGWRNTKSCIRLGMQKPCNTTHHGRVVDGDTFTPFWVSWVHGVISFGRWESGNQIMLMKFTHTTPYPVNFLAVMTGFGSTGKWKFINDVTCNLEVYKNTKVIINNTTCNGTTTYECEHGYYLVQGNLERTCLTGKTWSGLPPVCERCMCPCSMQNQRLYNSSEELYHRIQDMRKILKMAKNSTNASLRKKISVPDSRPSSAGIGIIFGYGVIIVLVTLLVISDARILYRQLRFGTN